MGFFAYIGHVLKTIFLGLGTNAFDVFTDVGNGLYHYHPKNVTRYLGNSTQLPDNCIPHMDTNATGLFDCLEKDTTWAAITLACIQLPAVVLGVCAFFGALVSGCKPHFDTCDMKLFSILLLFVPFPVTVFIQQVTHLFVVNSQMELISAVFLFGEGSLEASPQLMLLLYIILSDSERDVATIQKVSIASKIITISHTSIRLYLNESHESGSISRDVVDHTGTNGDSMMKDRSLYQKLKLMVQFSTAFLTSLIFKVGSIAIICAFLKDYSAIYFGIGICLTFLAAFSFYSRPQNDEKTGSGLFYCLTNVTILAKCPLGSRKENFPQMMAVSIAWLILHTLTLIGLMIWYGAMDPSTHLPHWSNHRFTFHENQALFFATTCSVLVFGPISILALWRLKRQVNALEEKEDKVDVYEYEMCPPHPDLI